MKKNVLFLIAMVVVSGLLFMLRVTGIAAHIAVSVVGLLTLVVYTVATKKEWKYPVFEILMRVFYAVALITGAVIMNVHGLIIVAVIHKISAALFVVLLIVNEVFKAIKK